MADHPIQGLMKVAMENIKEMVDVNTIVGDPVETPDGSVIMPISRVGFGFAAGGSEFFGDTNDTGITGGTDANNATVMLPFGGGSGGGVSISPIAFLVVNSQGVKVVPLDNQTHIYERLIDSAPQVVEKIQSMLKGAKQSTAGMMGGTMGGTMGVAGGGTMGGNLGGGTMGGNLGGGTAGGNLGSGTMENTMQSGMAGGTNNQNCPM